MSLLQVNGNNFPCNLVVFNPKTWCCWSFLPAHSLTIYIYIVFNYIHINTHIFGIIWSRWLWRFSALGSLQRCSGAGGDPMGLLLSSDPVSFPVSKSVFFEQGLMDMFHPKANSHLQRTLAWRVWRKITTTCLWIERIGAIQIPHGQALSGNSFERCCQDCNQQNQCLRMGQDAVSFCVCFVHASVDIVGSLIGLN